MSGCSIFVFFLEFFRIIFGQKIEIFRFFEISFFTQNYSENLQKSLNFSAEHHVLNALYNGIMLLTTLKTRLKMGSIKKTSARKLALLVDLTVKVVVESIPVGRLLVASWSVVRVGIFSIRRPVSVAGLREPPRLVLARLEISVVNVIIS